MFKAVFIFIIKVLIKIESSYPLVVLKKIKNIFESYKFRCKTGCYYSTHIPKPSYVIGHKYIIHQHFTSGPGLRIECIDSYRDYKYKPKLFIGNDVNFNYNCHIGCINKIIIGDNVLIGSNVLITDHSHGYNNYLDINIKAKDRFLYSKGPVIIEDNVWICENVSILPGVNIGHSSIIGANSVVNRDVPPYSVVVGNPAKVIKIIPH